MNQFEIYQNKDGKYRFRLKIDDMTIVCSDFYETPTAVRNGIEQIRKTAPTADVIDLT